MSDEASKTERKLSRTGSNQTLQGIVGDTDADDIDVFGYELIYTTGEFTVPREALLEKADEVGIPEWMLPSKVRPHYAFGRMIDDLLDGVEEVKHEGQRVQFDLRQNDSRYSYTLDASVYLEPDEVGNEDGEWITHELGVIKYMNPDEGDAYVAFTDKVDPEKSLSVYWGIVKAGGEVKADDFERYDTIAEATSDAALVGNRSTFRARAQALFEKHKQSHTGKDVNNTTYYLVDQWTDSIRLRDACYFVPATHTYWVDDEERPIDDLIDAFAALYAWLNETAEKPKYAQTTEMNVVEIMDTDRQRDMVERKVQSRLEDMAEDMAESAVEQARDEDVVMEQVVGEVSEALDNLTAVAGEYDDLLDSQKAELKTANAVKRAVRKAMGGLDTDEEELVEQVLDEADGPTPGVTA